MGGLEQACILGWFAAQCRNKTFTCFVPDDVPYRHHISPPHQGLYLPLHMYSCGRSLDIYVCDYHSSFKPLSFFLFSSIRVSSFFIFHWYFCAPEMSVTLLLSYHPSILFRLTLKSYLWRSSQYLWRYCTYSWYLCCLEGSGWTQILRDFIL
jgi:hypothetical protein